MTKKYGVWAVRSCNSIFGEDQNWCHNDGEIITFDTMEEAAKQAEEWGKGLANVRYYPQEIDMEQDFTIKM